MSAQYQPAAERYAVAEFRRCGRSGVVLPAISLGLWQNFGGVDAYETGRAIIRRAFDRGITHFDLANNYGPPPGSAEANFGQVVAADLRPFRDEIVVSTKAGYLMWDGPYGTGGSRKHVLASLDQSLARTGLDYVDILYSHRPDPATPLAETVAALADAVRHGKALYVALSNYPPDLTRDAVRMLRELGLPCLVHQPRYSMLDRTIEAELLDTLEAAGVGCAVYSPLAQGLLSRKYLDGLPEGSRALRGGSLPASRITPELVSRLRALDRIAERRGQTLSQLALAWVLRDARITSAIIGARTVEQLDEGLDTLAFPSLDDDEIRGIDSILRE